MLLQKMFCQTWRKQITAPRFRLLLHHAQPIKQPSMRAFRSTAARNQPRLSSGTSQTQMVPLGNTLVNGPIPPINILKAIVFTGAFSTGCFLSATILEYENARNLMMEKARQAKFSWFVKRKQLDYEHNSGWQTLKHNIMTTWNKLTTGERVFVPICALNLLVFGMWRVPALRKTMMTYFCSNPAARVVCWPMVLCTFSHYSMFHIFANMYVLHSFASAAVLSLGKEQFLAVYLTSGVVASLASILYKALTLQGGSSIGASGAIMAILAYVCAQYPDTQLSILFLPMLTFSAGAAIKCMIGLDLVGCLLGWKFFDHAAHLGGALFGLFWAYYGLEVWQKRMPFMNMYHDWRK